ncbi:flagellar basal body rod protein FlgB, partial [Pseudomonas fortuita]|uniref:flagellar basal body rod protein FlgB n=1 Tax=Pseudomonas fortuita TaxID=3233375 RepID=UPI003C2E6387
MSINFEKALGSAERALLFRSQRAEVLSNNIANADTPNFKARDFLPQPTFESHALTEPNNFVEH